MRLLMAGDGYPMLATHDPRLIDIATTLALMSGRSAGRFEYQMLYGIRPAEQQRLAGTGAGSGSIRPTAVTGTATLSAGSPSARATSASSCVRWPRPGGARERTARPAR